MAKRIGNLNAQITADGLQFRAEIDKTVDAIKKIPKKVPSEAGTDFEDLAKSIKSSVEPARLLTRAVGDVLGMFSRVAGVASLAAAPLLLVGRAAAKAADDARAAHAALSKLSAGIANESTAFRDSGSLKEKLDAIADEATASIKAIKATKASKAEQRRAIDAALALEEQKRISAINEDQIRTEENNKRIKDQSAEQAANSPGGMAARAMGDDAVERIKEEAARRQQEWEAQLADPNTARNVGNAMVEQFRTQQHAHEDLRNESQKLNAQILRDEEELLKHKASIEKDAGKKKVMEAQARALEAKAIESDAALEISAIRRRIEDSTDEQDRKALREQIGLVEKRKQLAIKALEPDRPKLSTQTLEAIRAGSAEEARLRFTAGRTRTDDTGKRQLEAQKDANKLLRDIKKNTTPTNLEISLL